MCLTLTKIARISYSGKDGLGPVLYHPIHLFRNSADPSAASNDLLGTAQGHVSRAVAGADRDGPIKIGTPAPRATWSPDFNRAAVRGLTPAHSSYSALST